MVGDPGIEPGVGLPGGVTVRCRTLQHVARPGEPLRACSDREGVITKQPQARQQEIDTAPRIVAKGVLGQAQLLSAGTAMKKPKWVVEKERNQKAAGDETVWLFGLHAVRDALMNPKREKLRLIVTKNAYDKLAEAIGGAGIEPEMADPRKFPAPIDPQSVHQGAVLEVKPLDWGPVAQCCLGNGQTPPRVVLLDRVTDPHNVGAILRSAEVFGAVAVIGMRHHAAPETGALAKTASGALERQPYLRVRNLADTMEELRAMGYLVLGLDGEADMQLETAVDGLLDRPIALVLGAEGPGLRPKTKDTCDHLVRIDFAGAFGSLNVSNAAAVALYAARPRLS